MGKPRMIILIRHAQSEGNKNPEIHQSIPDHRVPLTPFGHQQAFEAGRKLRQLLRPDDSLHFFTSPYQRTRETTEGILASLTSDDPVPSPFPRHTIKVYEDPRLREQSFGNFQRSPAEMDNMWAERSKFGHFFYRIEGGESAADAYDRVAGFNDSLWRRFAEPDFASVCIIVTHGLLARIFLMKWYHWSYEYLEDLRNINHCEFLVMKKGSDDGKYALLSNLRTWTQYKRERAARGSISGVDAPDIPVRRGYGAKHDRSPRLIPKKVPIRQNTADLFKEDDELLSRTPPRVASGSLLKFRDGGPPGSAVNGDLASDGDLDLNPEDADQLTRIFAKQSRPSAIAEEAFASSETVNVLPTPRALSSLNMSSQKKRPSLLSLGGRDGGGSKSGAGSEAGDTSDEEVDPLVLKSGNHDSSSVFSFGSYRPRSLAMALKATLNDQNGPVMADALGDLTDSEVESTDAAMDDKKREVDEMDKILEDEKRERSQSISTH